MPAIEKDSQSGSIHRACRASRRKRLRSAYERVTSATAVITIGSITCETRITKYTVCSVLVPFRLPFNLGSIACPAFG